MRVWGVNSEGCLFSKHYWGVIPPYASRWEHVLNNTHVVYKTAMATIIKEKKRFSGENKPCSGSCLLLNFLGFEIRQSKDLKVRFFLNTVKFVHFVLAVHFGIYVENISFLEREHSHSPCQEHIDRFLFVSELFVWIELIGFQLVGPFFRERWLLFSNDLCTGGKQINHQKGFSHVIEVKMFGFSICVFREGYILILLSGKIHHF